MPNKSNKHDHHLHLPNLGESWAVILTIMLGWTCYSMADVGIKLLVEDYSIWQIMNLACAAGALMLTTWILAQKGIKGLRPKKPGWHALRAIIGAATGILITNAFARVPLADVYGITFAAPFVALILIHFFLKEHVGWPRWAAVAVGFTGVIIFAGPQFASLNTGYLMALGCMFTIAGSTVVLRKMGKDDHPALYGVYPLLLVFLVTLPLALPVYQMPAIDDGWKFFINIFGVMGGQVFVSRATVRAKEAAALGPFVYIQIIWGVVFGYYIFGDVLKPEALLGLPLIIGAGLFMIYRERKVKGKL